MSIVYTIVYTVFCILYPVYRMHEYEYKYAYWLQTGSNKDSAHRNATLGGPRTCLYLKRVVHRVNSK